VNLDSDFTIDSTTLIRGIFWRNVWTQAIISLKPAPHHFVKHCRSWNGNIDEPITSYFALRRHCGRSLCPWLPIITRENAVNSGPTTDRPHWPRSLPSIAHCFTHGCWRHNSQIYISVGLLRIKPFRMLYAYSLLGWMLIIRSLLMRTVQLIVF